MCAPDADAKVQAQILGHFTQQLVKPALSQRETAVAVEAVGALAASTTRNFGEPVSPAGIRTAAFPDAFSDRVRRSGSFLPAVHCDNPMLLLWRAGLKLMSKWLP